MSNKNNLLVQPESWLSLLDEQNYLVFWKDKASIYRGCNETYSKMLGLNSSELIEGLTDSKLNPLHESIYNQDDEQVIVHRKTISIQNPAYFKGFGLTEVKGTLSPVIDTQGNATGILGVMSLYFKLSN